MYCATVRADPPPRSAPQAGFSGPPLSGLLGAKLSAARSSKAAKGSVGASGGRAAGSPMGETHSPSAPGPAIVVGACAASDSGRGGPPQKARPGQDQRYGEQDAHGQPEREVGHAAIRLAHILQEHPEQAVEDQEKPGHRPPSRQQFPRVRRPAQDREQHHPLQRRLIELARVARRISRGAGAAVGELNVGVAEHHAPRPVRLTSPTAPRSQSSRYAPKNKPTGTQGAVRSARRMMSILLA